ncbi:thioredoxin-disulfide reductase [Candidatus Dependentiae bacterium]|nr:thioredoxin-disulfide reductase [Candidatus Dependentiae bacterium]
MNKNILLIVIASLLLLSSCTTIGQDKERFDYKVVIIGSGPAGLTAGIYTSRGNFDTLIVEGDIPGGLLTETPEIGNWPGEKSISGYDLMEKIRDHAKHEGCKLVSDSVSKIDFSKKPYTIFTQGGKSYQAQAIIIGTGAKRKKLGCPGEQEYWGKGVSACATCDAPFYRGKTVAVVGGGHTALTEAHHLARFAKKVIMIHRSSEFHVADPIKDKVIQDPKIEIIHDSLIQKIIGDRRTVTGVVINNRLDQKITSIATDGVFVAIGFIPNVEMFDGQLELDDRGFLKVSGDSKTSQEGVFAAGDVIHRKYQQAIVAAGDGCKAALDCIEYFDKG